MEISRCENFNTGCKNFLESLNLNDVVSLLDVDGDEFRPVVLCDSRFAVTDGMRFWECTNVVWVQYGTNFRIDFITREASENYIKFCRQLSVERIRDCGNFDLSDLFGMLK